MRKTVSCARNMVVTKIMSGGQTGADRAALDFAIENGIPSAGWCPKGRIAEDGVIPARYALTETPSSDAQQRTEWNARDSDGTVIFSIAAELTGGSKRTQEFAFVRGKPCLHISRDCDGTRAAARLRSFIREHHIQCLNVAGPRASEEPEITGYVREILMELKSTFNSSC